MLPRLFTGVRATECIGQLETVMVRPLSLALQVHTGFGGVIVRRVLRMNTIRTRASRTLNHSIFSQVYVLHIECYQYSKLIHDIYLI